MAVVTTGQLQQAMNNKDEQFFKLLGARIAQARKEQQLTQTQLAEQLGIAQQTMAHYEGGKLKVSAALLPQLAQILSLSLDELLGLPAPAEAASAARLHDWNSRSRSSASYHAQSRSWFPRYWIT